MSNRQVAKLENLGLIQRQPSRTDRRVTEAVVTAKGKSMTDRVDAARERIGIEIFKTWDPDDLDNLVRLMQKFADAVKDDPVKG
jgi:DNA-binding MarR family transcriptional regulator